MRPLPRELAFLATVLTLVGALLTFVALAPVATAEPASAAPRTATTTAPAAAGFVALDNPVRLVDTRAGWFTVDGRYSQGGRMAAGSVRQYVVAGRGGIASSAATVSLTLTAVSPSASGGLVVWACGGLTPRSASLHYVAGTSIGNPTISRVGAGGVVCVYTTAATELTIDANAYYSSSALTVLGSPQRIMDTRSNGFTTDGTSRAIGTRPAGSVTELQVAGRGGVTSAARTVVLDVSPIWPSSAGYLTAYACGAPRPAASTVYYTAGVVTDAFVVVPTSSTGKVCLYSSVATDIAVEALGSLPAGSYVPTTPVRLLDSRPGVGTTVDGSFARTGVQPADATMQLPVAGRGGLPDTASAVLVTVYAVAPGASSNLSLWAHGPTVPNTYDLVYPGSRSAQTQQLVRLGADGSICLRARSTIALVLDVVGYYPGSTAGAATAPCPSVSLSTSPDAVRSQLVGRSAMQVARGTDTVAVVVCHVPTGFPGYGNRSPLPGGATPTAANVAAAANASVTPYYRNVSGGAYVPTFVAYNTPTITLTPPLSGAPGGPEACLAQAQAVVSAGGYTNVFATDDRDVDLGSYSGLGGPGTTSATETRDVLHRGAPSTTLRGLWVEGGSVWNDPDSIARANSERQFFNPMIVAHELGHTINWPHSHLSDDDYDNPLDLMSGNPGSPGDGWCNFYTVNRPPVVEGFSAPCRPQSALAYDRMAAGWMTSRQSAISTGVVTYLLDAANSSSANSGGTQIVAAVDPADTQSVLTVEGRAAVGYDADLTEPYCASVSSDGQCENIPGKEGVAVHLVRQNPSYTGDAEGRIGVGLQRRAAQAIGEPSTFDHVLVPGQSVVVDGVHITVYPRVGNAYPVRIWGTYTTPAFMKDPAAAKRLATPAPTAPTPLVEDGDAGSTPRPPRVSF